MFLIDSDILSCVGSEVRYIRSKLFNLFIKLLSTLLVTLCFSLCQYSASFLVQLTSSANVATSALWKLSCAIKQAIASLGELRYAAFNKITLLPNWSREDIA